MKKWKIQLCKAAAGPAWLPIAVSCLLMVLLSCCSWLFMAAPKRLFKTITATGCPVMAQRKMIAKS
ncbi:hypothetical protein [Desulforamulus hydrothermalis]|uniref:hypothetical protein n=1 Tax=Desulforamulus hydrothermalis TaxID=412895 RepID=UPI0002F0562C|nr:hypothetical protein [Desulforamulus hydrothermalis]